MKALVLSDRRIVAEAIADRLKLGLDAEARTAASVDDALVLLGSWRPDLAVVDLILSAADQRRLHDALLRLGARTVALVSGAVDALRHLESGAQGIVTAEEGLEGLVRASRTVLDGHTHVPSRLLGGVLHGLIERRRHTEDRVVRAERLSTREREVLRLLCDGHDQVDIARSLAISPQTAKTHIRHVIGKLGVRSRVEAAAVAAELGITQVGGLK